ncbi:hypothetical protein M407DRAFT_229674 [Tulasnella calospora MUT 4182]|uniref:Lung seven transmembrane receptor-domain-containing protein n=2 Tax=Tulasnella calospora MUT 4182 TaxID=1051891 RepID=A0A0C3QXK2_9AGAM|nr:hypothetical protein M407DRAFT_229674 [Tulasnella calospora MUT 4182]
MVIYEWGDSDYLGVQTSKTDDMLPKTYICTTDAVRASLCPAGSLGQFIFTFPQNKSMTDTSIWTSIVTFPGTTAISGNTNPSNSTVSALWDAPGGNPKVDSDDPYASPWFMTRRVGNIGRAHAQPDTMPTTPMTGNPIQYSQPIHYHLTKTGYYCVGAIPVTVLHPGDDGSNNHTHAAFSGSVLFQNEFYGQLAASEYPKITFYMVMMLVYTAFAVAWAILCLRHRYDLLPIQNYVSALFALLIVEMLANWAYYRFQNAQGSGLASKIFLFVVSILDAARNSLSFFLLLIVALGLGVVREELDEMTKCRLLALGHALFGVLYAVGMDLIELETVSAVLLLVFVIPLAITMTVFLLWIMYGLTGTIAELSARRQKYKLSMFKTLYRILMVAVLALFGFFVVSSMSFSSRYDEDYAPRSWKSRWWLLDGFLVLLYMAVFVSVAFLWRPTGNNRRLAMSDELAQDEEEAEDYDLEAIQTRGERAKMEAMMGIDNMANGHTPDEGRIQLPRDNDRDVVFEIGEEGSDDERDEGRRSGRPSGERQGLMGKDRED